jgi:hypothetical protein
MCISSLKKAKKTLKKPEFQLKSMKINTFFTNIKIVKKIIYLPELQ